MLVDVCRSNAIDPIDPNHQPVGAGLEIDSTAAINYRTKPALPHQQPIDRSEFIDTNRSGGLCAGLVGATWVM
jgi:hypothetical protein